MKSVIGGLFSVITSASTNAAAGLSQHSANASLEKANYAYKGLNKGIKYKFYGKDYHDNDGDSSDG